MLYMLSQQQGDEGGMRRQIWMRRIGLGALWLIAAYWLFPWLASGLRTGAGVLLSVVFLLAYLFAVVLLPLMAFALLQFAYSVFLRPYLRLWRMKRKRNTRALREAIRRGR